MRAWEWYMDRARWETGVASLLRGIKLFWQPRRVRATASTRSMARFAHGPHARVYAIAIRRENAPRRIRAGRVDGEKVDGELCEFGPVRSKFVQHSPSTLAVHAAGSYPTWSVLVPDCNRADARVRAVREKRHGPRTRQCANPARLPN